VLDALYVSAVGLEAQKQQLDALASNLANLGTTAFKRQSIDFSSILDRATAAPALEATGETQARPLRQWQVDLRPGEVRATGRSLDIAIIGAGFLEVELPGEQTGYARAGSLVVNADGALSLRSGQVLKGDIRIPAGASDVAVLADGSVVARLPEDDVASTVGQIELAVLTNPERLQYRGEGVFTTDDETTEPLRTRPGENGTQTLATASLESSNVDMTDEMVSLMLMQRVYELNSRVMQVADELMGMTNNLRRG